MRHEKIKELLPLYLDNELTDEEKTLLENHLQDCQECRQELKRYQENQAFLSSLKKETAPAGFVETALKRINEIQDKDTVQEENYSRSGYKQKEGTFLKKIKGFFTFPVRVPAGVAALTAVILLLIATGLPGNLFNRISSPDNGLRMRDELGEYPRQNYSLDRYGQGIPSAPDAELKMQENSPEQNNIMPTDSLELADTSTRAFEQKIIKRANLLIEVRDIANIDNIILALIREYNGYISHSRSWSNQDKQRFSSFILRVPAENFDSIMAELSGNKYGETISRSISSQDVTEEYLDLNIRLNNLLSQEERYRQLLDQAAEVEEILQIENELNRVRTEIERLQGRQQYLDNQIGYSTIDVEFRQPEPISSGATEFFRAVRNAVSQMIRQFYTLIMIVGSAVPYLLLLAVGYLIYRRSTRH